MRVVISNVVREGREFYEGRRRITDIVEQVNTLSGQFDARVAQASSQMASEEHLDSSTRQNNEALSTIQVTIGENLETLKQQIT